LTLVESPKKRKGMNRHIRLLSNVEQAFLDSSPKIATCMYK